MVDQQGRWEFEFDDVDRVTSRTDPASKEFSWAYDAVGRRTRETDADGGHTYFLYDAAGQMTGIRNPNAETFGFEYDDASRLVAKELASGATTYMDYDDANRLSGIIHAKSDDSIIASFAYERDSRGNPISEEDADGNVRYFGYDELSRLTSETWVVDDEVVAEKVYVYDAASNRTRLEEDGEPVVYYEYDARNAMTHVRPLGGTATDMEYNASGSLVKETAGDDVTYYVWTAEEMLDRVQMPDESWSYFEYDGDLRRWEKTDAGGTKLYRWDAGASGRPGLAVVQEADADGDTTAAFTHDQGATIMPGVGTILSVREGDDSRFVHTDGQGTTRKVTSAAEAVIAAYDLDAFGVLRSHTGAYSTPYLFTGKERDPAPSLDYFIARQYQAARGVFPSKDPVRWGTHNYSYVWGRPLTWADPTGLLTIPDLGGLAHLLRCLAQWQTEGRVALDCFWLCLTLPSLPWCPPQPPIFVPVDTPFPIQRPRPGPPPRPGPSPGPIVRPPAPGPRPIVRPPVPPSEGPWRPWPIGRPPDDGSGTGDDSGRGDGGGVITPPPGSCAAGKGAWPLPLGWGLGVDVHLFWLVHAGCQVITCGTPPCPHVFQSVCLSPTLPIDLSAGSIALLIPWRKGKDCTDYEGWSGGVQVTWNLYTWPVTPFGVGVSLDLQLGVVAQLPWPSKAINATAGLQVGAGIIGWPPRRLGRLLPSSVSGQLCCSWDLTAGHTIKECMNPVGLAIGAALLSILWRLSTWL